MQISPLRVIYGYGRDADRGRNKTTPNKKDNKMKITRRILSKLETMSRNQLKDLHKIVAGCKVFGTKDEILEKTREALCEYLNIDV